jgi:hypothetical protein
MRGLAYTAVTAVLRRATTSLSRYYWLTTLCFTMCIYMHAWMLLELVILSASTHAQTCPRPVPCVTQPSSNFLVPRQELGRRLIMTWCVCRSSSRKGKRVPWLEDMLKLEIKTNTTDSEREPPVALTFKWKVRSKDVGKNRPPPPPHDTLPLNMHLCMCAPRCDSCPCPLYIYD